MGNILNSWKEKQKETRLGSIEREAEYTITVRDFNNALYIAYNDTPVISVADTDTPKDIISKLNEIRKNYISYRSAKNTGRPA